VLLANNLRESVLAERPGLVETLEQAIRGRDAGRVEQTAAQAAIDTAIASARAAARKLDMLVRNQFADDPVTLRVWDTQRTSGARVGPGVRRPCRHPRAAAGVDVDGQQSTEKASDFAQGAAVA
jgi:hypothetical protein